MRWQVSVVMGFLLVVSILGCMTTSRLSYEREIVFDKLGIQWGERDYTDGRKVWAIEIWCRAMNNNATTSISVDYDGYIRYWMEGKGYVTMSNLDEVHLNPKGYENVGFVFEVEDDPDKFTELEYGFAYGGLEREYVNRTIHPAKG